MLLLCVWILNLYLQGNVCYAASVTFLYKLLTLHSPLIDLLSHHPAVPTSDSSSSIMGGSSFMFIIVPAAAGALAVFLLLFILYRRRKKKQSNTHVMPSSAAGSATAHSPGTGAGMVQLNPLFTESTIGAPYASYMPSGHGDASLYSVPFAGGGNAGAAYGGLGRGQGYGDGHGQPGGYDVPRFAHEAWNESTDDNPMFTPSLSLYAAPNAYSSSSGGDLYSVPRVEDDSLYTTTGEGHGFYSVVTPANGSGDHSLYSVPTAYAIPSELTSQYSVPAGAAGAGSLYATAAASASVPSGYADYTVGGTGAQGGRNHAASFSSYSVPGDYSNSKAAYVSMSGGGLYSVPNGDDDSDAYLRKLSVSGVHRSGDESI